MPGRRFIIAAGALVFTAFGSAATASADDIPDNVSQHSHNSYAVGGWHFDESNGSTGITVQISDEFTVAPEGLKFRAKTVCVGIVHVDEDAEEEAFDFVWGCKEIDRSEFDFDSRLNDAFVRTDVPVECISGDRCVAPSREVDLELSWTGGDSLVRTNGVSRNSECQIHRLDEFRTAMEVHGSVSDGVTEFTHGLAGTGAMESSNRTALVVGEPTDCS